MPILDSNVGGGEEGGPGDTLLVNVGVRTTQVAIELAQLIASGTLVTQVAVEVLQSDFATGNSASGAVVTQVVVESLQSSNPAISGSISSTLSVPQSLLKITKKISGSLLASNALSAHMNLNIAGLNCDIKTSSNEKSLLMKVVRKLESDIDANTYELFGLNTAFGQAAITEILSLIGSAIVEYSSAGRISINSSLVSADLSVSSRTKYQFVKIQGPSSDAISGFGYDRFDGGFSVTI